MSIKSMLDKVNISDVPAADQVKRAIAKTAPGRLIQFGNELEEAERKLAEYEGALPTKNLDSKRIRPSALRNRHEDSFVGDAWIQFKRDIAAAGGNTQAIKVRPITGDKDYDYEIVFGHRRHRACFESGIPVLAMIEQVSDRDLFEAMTRENVGRNDLSVWEWGEHYKRGLVHGFYSTQAQLASANQRSEGHVAVCLQIASLPAEVLAAFRSPLAIQWRWGVKLTEVQKQDAEGLRKRALELAAAEPVLPPQQVFAKLIDGGDAPKAGKSLEIKRDGKRAALIESKGKVVSVKFARGMVSSKRLSELRTLVDDFLAKGGVD
jgi:ParB family chromosome partitioning protein